MIFNVSTFDRLVLARWAIRREQLHANLDTGKLSWRRVTLGGKKWRK